MGRGCSQTMETQPFLVSFRKFRKFTRSVHIPKNAQRSTFTPLFTAGLLLLLPSSAFAQKVKQYMDHDYHFKVTSDQAFSYTKDKNNGIPAFGFFDQKLSVYVLSLDKNPYNVDANINLQDQTDDYTYTRTEISKQELIDQVTASSGKIIRVQKIIIAPQRSFSSLKAIKASKIIQKKYLQEALELNRKFSYIFEVIYPEASLVVNYGQEEDLVLIGVIDKETGKSIQNISELGFRTKKDLTAEFKNFKNLNEIEEANINNLEGVVLEYNNSLRIKIKFPWYKEIHKELQSVINAEYQMIESINKLKKYYGYKENPLSTTLIMEAIKNGRTQESFVNELNIDQIDRGAIKWVYRHWNKYQETNTSISEFFNQSFEYGNTPDDRIWKWKNRYLDKYYD